MDKRESGNARAGGGASVGKAVGRIEAGRLSGVYNAMCVGPRESERAAYVATRDEIADLERRGGGPITRLMRAIGRAFWLRELRERMASFVLEPKWADQAPNVVTTVGGNLALDTLLAGSSYSTTGPYMLLIDTNADLAAIGNTMASHAAWNEVGSANAPTYTGTRKTVAFSAASGKSKASSAASSFAITSSGTVGGCGLVLGSGASSTVDNTGGTLYSAGAFTGGDKIVDNGDTLNVTYTATI